MTDKENTTRSPEDSSSLRRRILTGGVAAGLTSIFIPAHWTRPIVQAVILPAHAQTSPSGDASGDGGCRDDVFPGLEVDVNGCSSSFESSVTGLISLEGGCISVATDGNVCSEEVPAPDLLRVSICIAIGADVRVEVFFVSTSGDESPLFIFACGLDGAFNDEESGPFLIGGDLFTAVYSIVFAGDILTVSDISFVPS